MNEAYATSGFVEGSLTVEPTQQRCPHARLAEQVARDRSPVMTTVLAIS